MTLLPLVIGGGTLFMALQGHHPGNLMGFTGLGDAQQEAPAPVYWWESSRPFIVDINGDGVEDIIGAIATNDYKDVVLTALSGADSSRLWEQHLGKREELLRSRPVLRYEPNSGLLSLSAGTVLTAYDVQTGAQRWTATLSDNLDTIAVQGDQLWVKAIDEKTSTISLADGAISAGEAKPSETAKALANDQSYGRSEVGTLDLKSTQFSGLRIAEAFCPQSALPVGVKLWNSSLVENIPCTHPEGLAFATRDKGTQVPFLLGYDRATKAERWRSQLGKAGSLETVDVHGVEWLGDDALVSFTARDDKTPRIRRFSLIDGSTKWETPIEGRDRIGVVRLSGVAVGKERVFVNLSSLIYVLDLADGGERAVLGGR